MCVWISLLSAPWSSSAPCRRMASRYWMSLTGRYHLWVDGLLRRWLVFPLKDEQPINERLDIVDYFFREPQFRMTIDDQLQRIGDLERIVSKVAVGRVTPREMVQLKTALKAIEPIKAACLQATNKSLQRVGERLHLCEQARDRIEREIQNDPPQLVQKGGVIRDGVSPELDEPAPYSLLGQGLSATDSGARSPADGHQLAEDRL